MHEQDRFHKNMIGKHITILHVYMGLQHAQRLPLSGANKSSGILLSRMRE